MHSDMGAGRGTYQYALAYITQCCINVMLLLPPGWPVNRQGGWGVEEPRNSRAVKVLCMCNIVIVW
jgi:hypothetical protein